MKSLAKLLARTVAQVRPLDAAAERVPTNVLMGWYLRKGLVPALRGLAHMWRFGAVRFPLFLGGGSRISYARKLVLEKGVFLGANLTLLAYSVDGVRIGAGVTIRENAWIQCASNPARPGVGLIIAAGTYIGPRVTIGVGGPIQIGALCQIGANCTLIAENHAITNGVASATEVTRKGITIGDRCWLGHGVTILDGVSLGAGCVVGAGAVVTRSYPAGSVLAGVPARVIGGQEHL